MARYKTDKEFREKLNHRSLEPEARVWEALSANLAQIQEPAKQKFNWWKYACAAMVLIALSIPVWKTNPGQELSGPQLTQQPAAKPQQSVEKYPNVAAAPVVRSQITPNPIQSTGEQTSAPLIAKASPEPAVELTPIVRVAPQIANPVVPEAEAPMDIPKSYVATGAKVHPRTLLASVDPQTKAPKTNWVREMETRYQSLRAAVAQRNIEEHQ